MNKQILDISTSTILRVVVVVIAVAFLFSVWKILASVFLAVVIASGLEPGVRALAKIKIPRLVAAILLYAVGFIILTSVFYSIFPTLITETRQLSSDLPTAYTEALENIEQFFGQIPAEVHIQDQMKSLLISAQQGLLGGASNIFAFTFNLFGGLLSSLLILVISFYLVLQKDGIEHLFKSFVPSAHEEYVVDLWKRVQKRLGRWFQGQLLLGIFVGTFMFLALWLMGVKYALSIAFMAGVLEIVPVIGPIVAGLIALVLISFQSPMLALAAIAVYIIIEQLQQHLFVPVVMSKTIGLNPVIIIVSLLVGAQLIGFWGIILALPIAVTLAEFVRDFRK